MNQISRRLCNCRTIRAYYIADTDFSNTLPELKGDKNLKYTKFQNLSESKIDNIFYDRIQFYEHFHLGEEIKF